MKRGFSWSALAALLEVVLCMENEKTKGEMIVDMLCDGRKVKDICICLGLSRWDCEQYLKKVRYAAGLPRDKRVYKARMDDIKENLEKWKIYKQKVEEIRIEYMASLVDFDF